MTKDDYIQIALFASIGLFLAERMIMRVGDWIWAVRRRKGS